MKQLHTFTLFLLPLVTTSVFTPRNRNELKHGLDPCFDESLTGHCPIFADQKVFLFNTTGHIVGQGIDQNGLMTMWDVSNVDAFSSVFRGKKEFNQNLENWTTTSMRNGNEMFMNAIKFEGIGLQNWDVSNLQSAIRMFQSCESFQEDLSTWKVNSLNDMTFMFDGAHRVNFNVFKWGELLPQQASLSAAFKDARLFQGDGLESWDTSLVTSLSNTFEGAFNFNGNIAQWDVSRVVDFTATFKNANLFNQPLDSWRVANGRDWTEFMSGATSFQHVLCSLTWILNTFNSMALDQRSIDSFAGVQLNAGPRSNVLLDLCCPSGLVSNGKGQCTKCSSGRFKIQNYISANAVCTLCPSGYYGNSTGMTSSQECDGLCPAGYYGDLTSVTRTNSTSACLLCPSGRASNPGEAGSVNECNSCGHGSTLISTSPTLTCDTCKSSTYLDTLALTDDVKCKNCPVGRVTCEENNKCGYGDIYDNVSSNMRNVLNHRTIESCRSCPKGRIYVEEGSLRHCVICPGGHYMVRNPSPLLSFPPSLHTHTTTHVLLCFRSALYIIQ